MHKYAAWESPLEKPRYDVFLSHATLDKPAVEELAQILRRRGLEPWLDIWNLIPGEPWQEAIEKALEDCAACAVCIGPSGTGPWQNAEMRAAIDLRISGELGAFRVIPVLLPGAVRGEPSRLPRFLRATTWVEFRETLDDERALHRLICGIQGIPPDIGPSEAVAPGVCPYRGLQVFDVGDALFFFGREALTGWLLDKLRPEDRSGSRFLAIVGPSGSGKSSLARAGLLAALKRAEIPGSDTWPVAVCKPGPEPLQSLSLAFGKAFQLSDASTVLNLSRGLLADPHAFHVATDLHLSLSGTPIDRRLVVLVDQFEEVFTLCPDEAQRRAIIANLLYAATAADGRTVVALTLRSDFYGRCAAYPDLAAAVSDRQSLVGLMTRDELRSAIERPAYLAGCELEGGLADLLLNEVESQPGCLPLLEHALLQIWQRRAGGRRLTIAAYREIGGVAGALEKHAEEVYAGFSEEERETCRQIFLRLVQVDEQGRATKRRLGLNELAPATSPVEAVVSRLTDARLLTTDQEKQPTVELAHEALLNNWARLKEWIEQDREALRTRRRLDEAVAEWLGKNRDPAFLLEGGRLAQVEEWAESHKGDMGSDARELLAASIAGRDQELQREISRAKALEEEQRLRADAEHQRAEEQVLARSRLRKWTVISVAAAALALITTLGIGYFWWSAHQQHKIDLAGQLAEQSGSLLKIDPMLSLLLAIKASRLANDGGQEYLSSPERALRSALSVFKGAPLPTGKVRTSALNADHTRLAVYGTDNSVSVWDLKSNDRPVKVAGFSDKQVHSKARQIAVGPTGQWVLIAYEEGLSRLFNIKDDRIADAIDLKGEDWLGTDDPFSPNGQWLLTRSASTIWLLRDLSDAKHSVFARLHVNLKKSTFSPNGWWLAAEEVEGRLKIWDLKHTDGDNLRSFVIWTYPQDMNAPSLTFSSDSQWLAAGGTEPHSSRFVQAWKIEPTLQPSQPIRLERCDWTTPGGPNFLNPLFISHISELADCLSLSFSNPIPRSTHSISIMDISLLSGNVVAGSTLGDLWFVEPRSQRDWANYDIARTGPIHQLAFRYRLLAFQSGIEAPRSFNHGLTSSEPPIVPAVPALRALSARGLQVGFDERSIYGRSLTMQLRGPHGAWPLTFAEPNSSWLFSPNDEWLAYVKSNGGTLVLTHLERDGRPSPPIHLPAQYAGPNPITALAFSPDGHWLATGNQLGESRLWNLRNLMSKPTQLTNHKGSVRALAFNSDAHVLATAGDDGIIRLEKITEGKALRPLPIYPENRGGPVTALAFLRDDQLAISDLNGVIVLWKDGNTTAIEGSPSGYKKLLSNSKGDSCLAGLAVDGTVQVWYCADDGRVLRSSVTLPILYNTSVLDLYLASDGNSLETSTGAALFRWELRHKKLVEKACHAAGRNLTEKEWSTYMPSETYQEREPCPEFQKAFD